MRAGVNLELATNPAKKPQVAAGIDPGNRSHTAGGDVPSPRLTLRTVNSWLACAGCCNLRCAGKTVTSAHPYPLSILNLRAGLIFPEIIQGPLVANRIKA